MMDVLIGSENIIPIGRELANTIEGSTIIMTLGPILTLVEILPKRMNLEILVTKLHFLDRTGSLSRWKRSQMKSI